MSSYVLANGADLVEKGYDFQYAERVPDGRVILPLSSLRVITDIQVTIMEEKTLKALIKEQKESGLYNDKPTILPETSDEDNLVGTEETDRPTVLPDFPDENKTEI